MMKCQAGSSDDRANSTTERVTNRTNASSAWTAPAAELRVFLNNLAHLGYNVDALLATAGLDDIDLDDPDARVHCETYGTIVFPIMDAG